MWILIAILLSSCTDKNLRKESLAVIMAGEPSITGNKDYLQSPYVTAGDRIYMIGYQDGSFPDLGWHIRGEMGGIWDHPVKLMDGFSAAINGHCLVPAYKFLNYPMANAQFYKTDSLEVERFQFVPDSLEAIVIEYRVRNPGTEKRNIDFSFTGMSDLQPVWLSDSLHLKNGFDVASYNDSLGGYVIHDSLNAWYVIFGARLRPASHSQNSMICTTERLGSGINATLNYHFSIDPGSDFILDFFISGSDRGKQHALDQFSQVSQNAPALLKSKIRKYKDLKMISGVELPDSTIQKMYTWLKYNTQWLVRDVPGIGRGLSAGLPDYPWWFGCDNEYALQGVLCAGQVNTVKSTIELLYHLSVIHNGNGRITHEVSTNNVVYNPGNVNETPQFIVLLRDYFRWTGDIDLIRKYYPFIQKGLTWVASMDKNGNLCPEGSGMMEIQGLNSEMIDVACYTCEAYEAASELANILGDSINARSYSENSTRLKRMINRDWWVPDADSYADFRSGKEKAVSVIIHATDRAEKLKKPWAVRELNSLLSSVRQQPSKGDRGYVVYHNWVVNTPMETGIADSAKAIPALQTAHKFTDPFGMYVTGIDRDENLNNANIDSMRKKVFSYTGAVMTLPTGVQAVAECRYGRSDEALEYIRDLSRSFSYALPGSMYEVSPDFGMMTQAWNIYGVAVPIVQYFFGINPDAYHKKILIKPAPPSSWNKMKISRLPVGNNFLTMEIEKTEAGTIYKFDQDQQDWTVVLELKPVKGATVTVNNHEQQLNGNNNIIHIEMKGLQNRVLVKQ